MQERRKRAKPSVEAQQLRRHESLPKEEVQLSAEELTRRLRLLGQPVMLFGEVSQFAYFPHSTVICRPLHSASQIPLSAQPNPLGT